MARGRSLKACDQAHQRRLAATRWSEQNQEFSFSGDEVNAIDGANLVEKLGDAPCFHNGHARVPIASLCEAVHRNGFGARHGPLGPELLCLNGNARRDDQIIFRSFHFAQIAFILASARERAFSGVSAPAAASANIVLITQVLKVSSIAALELPR